MEEKELQKVTDSIRDSIYSITPNGDSGAMKVLQSLIGHYYSVVHSSPFDFPDISTRRLHGIALVINGLMLLGNRTES